MAELSSENAARMQKRMREEIIAELMASGGISYDRAALELVYYIPDAFKNIYIRVFHEALAATDGNLDQRGRQGAETAALGRAPGKAAGKTKQKRGTFFIASEKALEIKEKADKRLRAIARDMSLQLDELHSSQARTVTDAKSLAKRQEIDAEIKHNNNGVQRAICSRCKKFTADDWAFCARCGNKLGA